MKKQSVNPVEAFNLAEALWESMCQGLCPWQKSWKGGAAPGRPSNVISGKPYRSGNALHLMTLAMRNGWSSKWVSFVETNKAGGNLKGQKGSKIEVPLIKMEVDSTGAEKQFLIGFRTAVVFNVDQVAGVEFDGKTPTNVIDSVDAVERMLAGLKSQGLKYVEPSQSGGCWYTPADDEIGMPLRSSFEDTYSFYSALVHEMAHSTMREGRVERNKVSYAYEELRAEIASTMICCTLNLPRTQAQIDNHASYMQPWLEEFEDKKSSLLKAASEGQLIHDYLIELSVTH